MTSMTKRGRKSDRTPSVKKGHEEATPGILGNLSTVYSGYCVLEHLGGTCQRRMETGKIRMSIHKDGDDLEITVSDNGAGMTQEMIRSVMAGKARNNGEDRYSTGIAVGNVIDRLELYYKQKGLLTIESDGLGLGTSVHITLPVEVEGTSE